MHFGPPLSEGILIAQSWPGRISIVMIIIAGIVLPLDGAPSGRWTTQDLHRRENGCGDESSQRRNPRPPRTYSWKPGETHLIPRVDGDDRQCLVHRCGQQIRALHRPWGPASISHDLYESILRQRDAMIAFVSALEQRPSDPADGHAPE